jgi:N,N'-diacetyllegionaminate synthase
MPLSFPRLVNGPVYVIAEIGVNHGGSVDLAKRMVVAAKNAMADAVKFQTFTANGLATRNTPKTLYQVRSTGVATSHYAMLESLELSKVAHEELFAFCASESIDFLSTPYDVASAAFLHSLGVDMFKTASADIVDLPLHDYIASTGKLALVSTGMSTLNEVGKVADIYGRGSRRLALLHCVSNYPCTEQSLNLRAMDTLRDAFRVPVGYSDHAVGTLASSVAVARGATVIEKHFTLDRTLPGPDHTASCEPEEFAELVTAIRRVERILGTSAKERQEEERDMAAVSRKSVVVARAVLAGSVLTSNDLTLRRPGTGIPPGDLHRVLGRRVVNDVEADHVLDWCDLS